jgi:3-hydroxy-9,10-secoandrosta-1,3,5(10)-triene-9,17-dione monooxygenase
MSNSPQGSASDLEIRRDLVATARTLVPVLEKYTQEGEQLRRLPAQTAGALRDAGMFRLAAPRVFGGHGAGVRTILEVTEELARGDAAAAWVTMILTGGAYVTGQLGDDARSQIWGSNPDTVIVGALSPSGLGRPGDDGSLTVAGKWAWASGADEADWAAVAVPVPGADGGPGEPELVLVPAGQLAIVDTWHVAGMSATGSKTLSGEGIVVPAERRLRLGSVLAGEQATQRPDEPFLRAAAAPFLALSVVGPMLGMARAALDLALGVAARKPMSLSFYPRLADSPGVQLSLADAASLVDTARLHAYRAADDLDSAAAEGRLLTVAERARVRMDAVVAAARSREAVDSLLSVAGASSFALASPLQKIWRDLGTASRHGTVNSNLVREVYGRALLGFEEQPTFLI